MSQRFAVIGSGAWGTTLALHTASLGYTVNLYCARPATAAALSAHRIHEQLLPGIAIPEAIAITASADEATRHADHWIVAVPTTYLRQTLERFTSLAPPTRGIISLTKGMEIGSFARPSEILAAIPVPIATLSGPSHAEEVARGLPTSLVIACRRVTYASEVQALLGSERFRLYSSQDVLGVELAGGYKNVLAIAAGVSDGLGYGDNAKAALLTRGLVEMTRFGVALGAESSTFNGLAGQGDLIATCFSPHGRNRRAGERIARGMPVSEAVGGPQVVEGYFTARSVYEKSTAMGLELPIATSVYELLYDAKPAAVAVWDLMARQQRMEHR